MRRYLRTKRKLPAGLCRSWCRCRLYEGADYLGVLFHPHQFEKLIATARPGSSYRRLSVKPHALSTGICQAHRLLRTRGSGVRISSGTGKLLLLPSCS